MQIEEAVFAMLAANPTIAGLVGDRIWPGQAPQNSDLPAILYSEAAQKSVMSLTGRVNLNSYSMHLDVWGESYAQVKACYHALRDCLAGYRGQQGDGAVRISGIFEETGDDDNASPIHGEESGLWRAGLDVSLWYSN